MIEVKDHDKSYPVGELTYNGHTIRINFMHYPSFEEAKSKWEERKKRVNYSNIYIVQIVASNLTQEHVDKFISLPYKNKLLITHKNDFKGDNIISHKIFSKNNYKPGEFLKYKTCFSRKRYMDDIDYISWLNNK